MKGDRGFVDQQKVGQRFAAFRIFELKVNLLIA